jgi:hypothetical protein
MKNLLGKRRMLLAALAPEFLVADYKRVGLRLFGLDPGIANGGRSKMAPSASREPPCL